MECPFCKEKMDEGWDVENEYIIGISNEDGYWNFIKDGFTIPFFICIDCDIKLYKRGNKDE